MLVRSITHWKLIVAVSGLLLIISLSIYVVGINRAQNELPAITEQEQLAKNTPTESGLIQPSPSREHISSLNSTTATSSTSTPPVGDRDPRSQPAPGETATETSTNMPTPPPCGLGSNYVISTSRGATIVPGKNDIGNHCLDCLTTITLPFAYSIYGRSFNTINVSDRGNLQFLSDSIEWENTCLPFPGVDTAIFAYWDDVRTDYVDLGSGVFTSVSGAAPNRIFNIEWRVAYMDGSVYLDGANWPNGGVSTANFEVRLYEKQERFDLIYGTLDQLKLGIDSATIGVQRGTGNQYTQYLCDTKDIVLSGLQLTFRPYTCNEPTFTPARMPTNPPTRTPTKTSTNTPTPTITLTSTNTPTQLSCAAGSNYVAIASTGASIVPGTTDTGMKCFDCVTTINLPFAYYLYGQSFTTVTASSHGTLQLGNLGAGALEWENTCLPYELFNTTIFAYWDDIRTDGATGVNTGVFTSLSGASPHRIFNIEWRACVNTYIGCGSIDTQFEVRLYEGEDRFDIIYAAFASDITPANYEGSYVGLASPTIGVQRGAGSQYTAYLCDGNVRLRPGTMLTFRSYKCNEPTFTPTSTSTSTATPTSTSTPTITNTPTITGTPTNTGTRTNTRTITTTPTITNTPTITGTPPSCGPGSDYVIAASNGAAIVPGTLKINGVCFDCVTTLTLPFQVQLYGQHFSTVNVSSHGNLQFRSSNIEYDNRCLPYSDFDTAIFAYWEDVRIDDPDSGVFISTTGASPNRIFNIEWRASYTEGGGGFANFEVRLYESQDRFDLVYGYIDIRGDSETIGVQRDNGSLYTQFLCNTSGVLQPDMMLTFRPRSCDGRSY